MTLSRSSGARRAALALAGLACLPSGARPACPPVLVTAREVHVGDGTVHRPGALLVEDGAVRAIGPRLEPPEGALTWDLPSAVLTPWLVDAGATVAPAGGETGRVEAATLSAGDARLPFDPAIDALRARGVGAAALVPVAASGPAGRTSVASTDRSTGGGAPLLVDHAALHVVLPATGAGAAARQQLSQSLEDAARSVSARRDWEAERARPAGERARTRAPVARDVPGGPDPLPHDDGPEIAPPARVLAQVLDGELLLRVTADRATDVAHALDVARRHDARLVLSGCGECAALAERIAPSLAIVVLEPLNAPSRGDGRPERGSGTPARDVARRLHAAGVAVAAASGAAWPDGPLALRAAGAALAGAGLPHDVAVAAVTGVAARAAGAPHAARLAVGEDARFLAWDGSPLDPRTRLLERVTPESLEARASRDRGDAEVAQAATDARVPAEAEPHEPRARGPRGSAWCAARAFDGSRWLDDVEIVLDGARIAAVRPGACTPGDPSVLTPGWLDADSAFGILGTRDETPEAFSHDLRLADALAPDERERETLRRSGVTSAWLAPGPTQPLGARAALVQPAPAGAWPRVLHAAHGSAGSLTESARRAERAPTSLAGQARGIAERMAAAGAEARPLRLRFDDGASARHVRELGAIGVGLPRFEGEAVSPLVLSGLGPGASEEQLALGARIVAREPDATWLGSGTAPSGPLALRTAAHLLVEHGAPAEAVLAAACGHARLEPGARADLAWWTGDPTGLMARPVRVLVGGEEVFHEAP